MTTRIALAAVGAAILCCTPIVMSTAGAAPTLIRLETAPPATPSALELATDRCVAQVKARDFAAALSTCDSAVLAARRARENTLSQFRSRSDEDAIAIAYNNRAVLRYLSGQLTLASSDAARAMSASPLPDIASTAAVIAAAIRRVAKTND